MTNIYYSIPVTTSTDMVVAIKNALISKYGAGVTIHFQSSSDLIFTCSALSNKVIRIYCLTAGLRMYYGDVWTSGITITNQVLWAGYTSGVCTVIDIVLGDNTFLLCSYQNSLVFGTLQIIGKLSNDKFAVLSACGSNNSSVYPSFNAKNTTDNLELNPITFSGAFASASGKLYKQPLILQRADGKVELNADASIASFRDIYNCSHALIGVADLVGANYLMSAAELYYGAVGKRFWTSMISEF